MLNKNLIDKLKKEFSVVGVLFIVFLIVFKILFYKESLIIVIKTVFALFWIFVLPGFALMYYWHDKLNFLERLIIGITLSAALIGLLSYYLGLFGLNIKYHGFLLPILFLIIAFVIIVKKKE